MVLKFLILNSLLWGWAVLSYSQMPDSIAGLDDPVLLDTLPVLVDTLPVVNQVQADTVVVTSDTAKKKGFIVKRFFNDYPSPKKAVFLSLVVPGAGQFYNKRWWKTPFIYGGYYLFIRAIQKNTTEYRSYRDAYILALQNKEHAYSNTRLSTEDLRRIRDGYDKNKQLSIIGLVALHLVQTAEAFVDCHLKTFDVSDDLSLKIVPAMGSTAYGESTVGIGLRFQLGRP